MLRPILPLLLLLTLTACATVHGAGQDLSKAGNFVSESADSVQQRM